ncbi:iron chaperone [Streptomyces polyrhachis]|uniref:Iron chaperone n=1 Tax=Streptomyces polyrhachis TaxID=1282885 RepID=A0ABW2GDX2_9ACTN
MADAGAGGKSYDGFTEDERAAMKERAKELKGESGGKRVTRSAQVKAAEAAAAVVEKIGEMEGSDRVLSERLHELITTAAPELAPKLWYGMPAYARDGKIVCFVQCAAKFKARYLTLGFNDVATLDEGTMWPTAFAITELTPAQEEQIAMLVKKAVG